MSRSSFEHVSFVKETLDADLVQRDITPGQYAEAIHEVLLAFGWTEDEYENELMRRWSMTELS